MNEEIKKVKKEPSKFNGFLRVASFLLVLFLLLSNISYYVFNAENLGNRSHRMVEAFSYFKDPDNTDDIVAIGNSDMYSAFVPTYLWEDYGFTSSVIGSAHQTSAESYALLEDFLEYQTPKVLLLEVDMLYDGKDLSEVDSDDLYSEIQRYIKQEYSPDYYESLIKSAFTIFAFHSNWVKDIENSDTYNHGFFYSDKETKNVAKNYMVKTDEVEYPVTDNITELDEIMLLCQENNIKVVFVENPATNSWNYARHNGIQEIADDYGVNFVDFNLLYNELGINQETCFRDDGWHVNFNTAKKITKYLGKYIKNGDYGVTSRSSDADITAYWDNEAAMFRKVNNIK